MLSINHFSKRVLGIAVGERGLRVAEVACNGGGGGGAAPRLLRSAAWRYPPAQTLAADAGDIGRGFAAFLRDSGFVARRAVLGVPARWLTCRTRVVPPAGEAEARAVLRLAAEADAAPEMGEMAFDYSGPLGGPTAASEVTLIGLPCRWRDRLSALAAAAGLDVAAITPGLAALAAAGSGGRTVLWVDAEGAEMARFDGPRVMALRHLRAGTAGTAGACVAAEVRRAVALGGAGAGPSMTIWDEVGLSDADVAAIGDGAGGTVARGSLRALGVEASAGARPADGAGAAASAAVALLALPGRRPEIDFARPRLAAAPRRLAVGRPAVWAAAAAVFVAVVAAGVYADLARIRGQIADVDGELGSMNPDVRRAEAFVADARLAENFRGLKPRSLACVRDVAELMPETGGTYLTGFTLQADLKGTFAGRSASERDVLDLMDKLNAGVAFADLKCKLEGGAAGPGGPANGTGAEVAFSVTFTYVPHHP